MTDSIWRLDPTKLPQQLDLEISEELHDCLVQISSRLGQPVCELAENLIYLALSTANPGPGARQQAGRTEDAGQGGPDAERPDWLRPGRY